MCHETDPIWEGPSVAAKENAMTGGIFWRVLFTAAVALHSLTGACHPKEVLHFRDQAAVFGIGTRGASSFHVVCKAVNGCD